MNGLMARARCGVVMVVGVLGAGCVGPTTPAYDARFGEAVRQAQRDQTLHEAAPAAAPQPLGLDGAAGRAAVERYHESFRAPPKSFEVLNIGGASNGAPAP